MTNSLNTFHVILTSCAPIQSTANGASIKTVDVRATSSVEKRNAPDSTDKRIVQRDDPIAVDFARGSQSQTSQQTLVEVTKPALAPSVSPKAARLAPRTTLVETTAPAPETTRRAEFVRPLIQGDGRPSQENGLRRDSLNADPEPNSARADSSRVAMPDHPIKERQPSKSDRRAEADTTSYPLRDRVSDEPQSYTPGSFRKLQSYIFDLHFSPLCASTLCRFRFAALPSTRSSIHNQVWSIAVNRIPSPWPEFHLA